MKNAFRAGRRIYFRPIELEDGPRFQEWMNDPENHQYLNRYRPLNAAEEKEWLEGLHKSEANIAFGVALVEGDQLIGSCGLHRVQLPARRAELGIAIGDRRYQGKGYGAEAIGLLLAYAFDTLNLHKVQLDVYAHNARGIRCYEKCGFRREGTRREALWWGGRWWDLLEYGILAREWIERTPREAAK